MAPAFDHFKLSELLEGFEPIDWLDQNGKKFGQIQSNRVEISQNKLKYLKNALHGLKQLKTIQSFKQLIMVPNGYKWHKNGSQQVPFRPNQSIRLKMAPNDTKFVQISPNGSKWVQMGPNRLKQDQINQNWSKLFQKGLNHFKLIQLGINRSKDIKYDMLWFNMD